MAEFGKWRIAPSLCREGGGGLISIWHPALFFVAGLTRLCDPKKMIMKPRANRGHGPARQLTRVSADSAQETVAWAHYAGGVLRQRELFRAFGSTAQTSIAGSSTASAFNAELQVDLLLLGDAIALRAKGVYSKNSP